LVGANPLRERLVRQLMLALYRAGQTAEALAAYRDARGRLAADLGLDPGPDLQRLERAILRDDPEVAAPVPMVATAAAPPVLAAQPAAAVAPASTPAPAQLPPS